MQLHQLADPFVTPFEKVATELAQLRFCAASQITEARARCQDTLAETRQLLANADALMARR